MARFGAKINSNIDITNEAKIKVNRSLSGSLSMYSFENIKILAEMKITVRDIIILFWSISKS